MEQYAQLTKEEKKLYWQKHIADWEESGVSQKKYCVNNSISYWNFKSWFGKIKSVNAIETKRFIRLDTDKFSDNGKFEVILPDGIIIRVGENIPEKELRKIFSAAGCA
ncbi:MAG TPA: IS66 family insertion sequence element accessory protein TnpB [Spirochaetota bacterium]|nr:IS66 family insertion sequence element accessory protein TnpB [Spirochaetota bacterium]